MQQADLLKAKELSSRLKNLGYRPTPLKDTPRVYVTEAPAPSATTLSAIIEPLVKHHIAQLQAPTVEVTPDLVKEIVKAMHALPEQDKLEVSKGIRNAQSFIYGGTKYNISEMMHGGSAASTSSVTFVNNETVSGSGTSFTLANTPTAGSVDVYALGQHSVPTTDYSISGAVITTVSSWSAGDIVANYRY